jgi:hypothetical protein
VPEHACVCPGRARGDQGAEAEEYGGQSHRARADEQEAAEPVLTRLREDHRTGRAESDRLSGDQGGEEPQQFPDQHRAARDGL